MFQILFPSRLLGSSKLVLLDWMAGTLDWLALLNWLAGLLDWLLWDWLTLLNWLACWPLDRLALHWLALHWLALNGLALHWLALLPELLLLLGVGWLAWGGTVQISP